MNIVVLSGRVGKTPETRNTPAGQKAVTFSLAIDRKDKSGNKITGNTVGALCARDYKGVGNQYVADGKCIVEFLGE